MTVSSHHGRDTLGWLGLAQMMVRVTAAANMLEKTAELVLGEYQVDSLAVSAKNGQIATGTDDGVKLYATGETIAAMSESKSDLPAADDEDDSAKTQIVCFSPGGKVLATGDNDGGRVGVYDFPSLKRFATLDTELKGVRYLALSSAGASQMLAINGKNGSCAVWQVGFAEKTPTRITQLQVPAEGKADFRGCDFIEASGALITGVNVSEGRGRKMKVKAQLVRWSTASWKVEAKAWVLNNCGLTAMSVCKTTNMIGVGGSDGTVGVFDADTLSRVFTVAAHGMAVTGVVLVPPRAEGDAPKLHLDDATSKAGDSTWRAHPPLLVSVALNNVVLATPVVPMTMREKAKEQMALIIGIVVLLIAMLMVVLR